MITVCARWDMVQLPCEIEWNMYRQMKGAFKVDRFVFAPIALPYRNIDQFETMDEALADCVGERIFLEPTGIRTLSDIPDGDIVLIVGNTNENNLSLSLESERYRISTPGITDLYGVNAAAIALAHRVN